MIDYASTTSRQQVMELKIKWDVVKRYLVETRWREMQHHHMVQSENLEEAGIPPHMGTHYVPPIQKKSVIVPPPLPIIATPGPSPSPEYF